LNKLVNKDEDSDSDDESSSDKDNEIEATEQLNYQTKSKKEEDIVVDNLRYFVDESKTNNPKCNDAVKDSKANLNLAKTNNDNKKIQEIEGITRIKTKLSLKVKIPEDNSINKQNTEKKTESANSFSNSDIIYERFFNGNDNHSNLPDSHTNKLINTTSIKSEESKKKAIVNNNNPYVDILMKSQKMNNDSSPVDTFTNNIEFQRKNTLFDFTHLYNTKEFLEQKRYRDEVFNKSPGKPADYFKPTSPFYNNSFTPQTNPYKFNNLLFFNGNINNIVTQNGQQPLYYTFPTTLTSIFEPAQANKNNNNNMTNTNNMNIPNNVNNSSNISNITNTNNINNMLNIPIIPNIPFETVYNNNSNDYFLNSCNNLSPFDSNFYTFAVQSMKKNNKAGNTNDNLNFTNFQNNHGNQGVKNPLLYTQSIQDINNNANKSKFKFIINKVKEINTNLEENPKQSKK